jgi:hypothetical protein
LTGSAEVPIVDTSTEKGVAMPEQPEGGQRPPLHPLILQYFANRHPPRDPNKIPPNTYAMLLAFPVTGNVQVLVDVLNGLGESLEKDTGHSTTPATASRATSRSPRWRSTASSSTRSAA